MPSDIINICDIPIADLEEDPENPNRMSGEEYDALKRNIAKGGFWQPILVRCLDPALEAAVRLGATSAPPGTKFQIVDGHHRARAAAESGMARIPAVVWDGSEDMRRAFAIGMNKIRGELDLSVVSKVVKDLSDDGWGLKDLTITGFSEEELESLLKTVQPEDADEVLAGVNTSMEDDEGEALPDRPHVLELSFASREEMQKAKRGLRRAAGKGRELGEGLLNLLGQRD